MELKPGEMGYVRRLEDDGDAFVELKGHDSQRWISKYEFGKIETISRHVLPGSIVTAMADTKNKTNVKALIKKGSRGKVTELDDIGNALIHFGDKGGEVLIDKWDFTNLQTDGQGDATIFLEALPTYFHEAYILVREKDRTLREKIVRLLQCHQFDGVHFGVYGARSKPDSLTDEEKVFVSQYDGMTVAQFVSAMNTLVCSKKGTEYAKKGLEKAKDPSKPDKAVKDWQSAWKAFDERVSRKRSTQRRSYRICGDKDFILL